jgi:hypothetical protein
VIRARVHVPLEALHPTKEQSKISAGFKYSHKNQCKTNANIELIAIMADAYKRITIYYDNQAAVDWAALCMNKGTKHINLRENYIRKCHQHGVIKVSHIPSVINASDLSTKELKDAAHFRQCRDSFMVSKARF